MQLEPTIWSKSYELGHSRLDSDHRHLVVIVNMLAKAINELRMTEALALMRYFIATARRHFDVEEELMAKCNFINIERHKQYHQRLLSYAKRIEMDCEFSRHPEYIRESYSDFIYCLLDDVMMGDKELVPILNEVPQ